MSPSRFASPTLQPARHEQKKGDSTIMMNGTAKTMTASGSRNKQRVTVFLSSPLVERLRNAVYWTETRTLAQIIGDAVEDAVTELEQANGGSFPARLAPLKPGRPRRPSPSKTDGPSLHLAREQD